MSNISKNPGITEVEKFWNENPLFTGEENYNDDDASFFVKHKDTYYQDVFAGNFEADKFIPRLEETEYVLDLGCGIGFWTTEILQRRAGIKMMAVDLTESALEIASKRLAHYGLTADFRKENAEQLTFQSESFDHINCQGVIHHTPDTQAAIKEIHRVLKNGATANISVYYKNFFLKNWQYLYPAGNLFRNLGAKFRGRGRENILMEKDVNSIVRLYDGSDNPIGKAYSKAEFETMLAPYFDIVDHFLYFFPARVFPFKIPGSFHRFLAKHFGFMIHYNLRKR